MDIFSKFESEVCQVLSILLTRLATGWERQRGDIFSFGPNTDLAAKNRFVAMNQDKLENAPINNPVPKRYVGFVNYGLKMRGAKELPSVSRAHVKGKGVGLIEGQEMDIVHFKKMTSKEDHAGLGQEAGGAQATGDGGEGGCQPVSGLTEQL